MVKIFNNLINLKYVIPLPPPQPASLTHHLGPIPLSLQSTAGENHSQSENSYPQTCVHRCGKPRAPQQSFTRFWLPFCFSNLPFWAITTVSSFLSWSHPVSLPPHSRPFLTPQSLPSSSLQNPLGSPQAPQTSRVHNCHLSSNSAPPPHMFPSLMSPLSTRLLTQEPERFPAFFPLRNSQGQYIPPSLQCIIFSPQWTGHHSGPQVPPQTVAVSYLTFPSWPPSIGPLHSCLRHLPSYSCI